MEQRRHNFSLAKTLFSISLQVAVETSRPYFLSEEGAQLQKSYKENTFLCGLNERSWGHIAIQILYVCASVRPSVCASVRVSCKVSVKLFLFLLFE